MTEPNDSSAIENVTMVRNAIHNPAEPRHFMRVVPAGARRTATIAGVTIAASDDAVVVKEVGRDIYDAVVYFPRADVRMDALTPISRTTHCPLKGDTEYFDVEVDAEQVDAAAWSYVDTLEFATELRGLIAFDTSSVIVA